MSNASLITSCSYHFGDTPGLYQDAAFVGHSVSIPMRVVWLDEDARKPEVTLVFTTQGIETWGNWEGHRVLVGDKEVGRLRDPDDHDGRYETFKLSVEKSWFKQVIDPTGTFLLTIVLDTQPEDHALSDDFLLRRIEAQNAAIRLGT